MGTQTRAFRYNHRFLKLAIALAAPAVVFGLYSAYSEWPQGPDLAQGFLLAVFAAVILLWLLNTLTDRSVVVSVGPDGVYDRRLSSKPIPWHAITAIRGYDLWDSRLLRWLGTLAGARGSTNRFVGLIVESPERYFRPPRPLVGLAMRLTSWVTGYPLLSINMSPLDATHADLIAALRSFAPADRIKIEP